MRLDQFLAKYLTTYSRAKIQDAIRADKVRVNDHAEKPSYRVQDADLISVSEFQREAFSALSPKQYELDIVFEDDELIVVNKPAGLTVHPGAGEHDVTLVEALLAHAHQLSRGTHPFRPGIVHRLDKDTSGLLVCAKTDEAHAHLAQQFQAKTNYRAYRALLLGHLRTADGRVDTYIGRNPGSRTSFKAFADKNNNVETMTPESGWKRAISFFSLEQTLSPHVCLAKVQLETGRTHQIRVHARHIGRPVLGDPVYGPVTADLQPCPSALRVTIEAIPRQMLHAYALGFIHPKTQEKIAFTVPDPQDMADTMSALLSTAANC